jgi:DNA-binding CsgD family transcriptional regulator/tetratricopeptide (TPR) repeat protein
MATTRQVLQVPDGAQAILEAAALLDQPFSVPLLIELGFLADLLDPLFDYGILQEQVSARAEFTSSELRSELLDRMPWSKRRRLCEQIARLLSQRRETLGHAAEFFCRAHRYGAARVSFMRAAEEARDRGYYAEAFGRLQQALKIWPPGEDVDKRSYALKEVARCARHSRDFVAARVAWEEILATSGATGSADDEVEAHNQIAELSQLLGDHAATTASLTAAAEIRQRRGPDLAAARQWFALASYLTYRIRPRDGIAALALAREAAEKAKHLGLLSEILSFEGLILAMMAKHDEARVRADSALELALNNNFPMQAAMAYRVLADLREFKADYTGARDAQMHAISFCRGQGSISEEHTCLSCLGYVLFRTGQWRSAIEGAREVLMDKGASRVTRAFMAALAAMIGVLRGERRRGNPRLAEALFELRTNNIVILEFFVLWVRAVMADLEGNYPLADAQYRELLNLWHRTEDRIFAVPGVVSAAGFYADRGDRVNLAACCEIVSVIAQENRNDETRAGNQAVFAESARCYGDLIGAASLMHEAIEGYDRLGTMLEMAFLRRRLALVLATMDRPRAAEEKRREATELARRLGLRPFLDCVRTDTASTSSSLPRDVSRSAVIGLTPRQRSILSLIAKGLTNKEIASHLNLSARTIEMHVALALERLNCRTRSEAVRRALSQGLLKLNV